MASVTQQQRHMQAMMAPRAAEEQAVVHLLKGLQTYLDVLTRRDETRRKSAGSAAAERRDDATDEQRTLLDAVQETADSARRLVDGDVGRLDGELLREAFARVLADCAKRRDDAERVVQSEPPPAPRRRRKSAAVTSIGRARENDRHGEVAISDAKGNGARRRTRERVVAGR